MGSMEATKPHAVCVPYPAQGHVTPMMRLAKLLHSKGFHITFVNTEFNHHRLIRSRGPDSVKGLPDFRFETIPDGLPPSDKDATQDIPALCDSTRKNCLLPFVELLKKLDASASAGVPPVTCVVADGIMGFGSKAARMLGIPEVQFWTASACGLMGYLQYSELLKRGIVPFKDESFLSDGTLETYIDWVPAGLSNVRLRDLPSFMRTTDPNDIMFDFLRTESEHTLKSSAIVLNTFDELEQEALDALATTTSSPIYTIGPLPLLERHLPEETNLMYSFRSSLWKEDSTCIDWLDRQKPRSVIYVNYGSITVMSDKHLKEFAWGLADSKRPFLWIVRPDVVMGESAALPREFLEEVRDRSFLAHWCAQDEVLKHPSIAVFLTHCGWNSTVEAIGGGKPMFCWPFFAEQQTNCRYACIKWENGLEVDPDVKREDIKALVEEMMEKESGKKLMENAFEWKKNAEAATDVGGSSYLNFDNFVGEALLRQSY